MKKYILLAAMALSLGTSVAQQANTLYFLDNATMRYQFNPAYDPQCDIHIGLPVLGGTSLAVGNNSLTLNDLFYTDPLTDKTSWFFGDIPAENRQSFYDGLKHSTDINADLHVNLLSFGWRHQKSYWHVFMGLKQSMTVGVPRDLLGFALFGESDHGAYDLQPLGLNENLYIEAGVGYSRNITEQIRVGGSFKYLYGLANISFSQDQLYLDPVNGNVQLQGEGNLRVSAPMHIPDGGLTNIGDLGFSDKISDYLTPSGMGAAIDLGVTYNPLEMLTLSLSLTDLGFLNWFRSPNQIGYATDYEFSGFDNVGLNTDFTSLVDSLVVGLQNSTQESNLQESYATMLAPKLNIGAEANFWDDRVGAGLIYSAKFLRGHSRHEVTVGGTFRPVDWFNFALNYSLINGKWSTVGAGIGLGTNGVNFTIMADYIPFHFASVNGMSVPSRIKSFNLGFGLNIAIGRTD